MLPLPEGDAQLDALIVHELTHLLVSEIILPRTSGDGGVPRWVQEGIASYMVGVWPDDDERLMRELVASGEVPALSQLTGSGGFANARLNDALGHAAFDYIESRWGPTSIRRFLNALIVPRVDKTYDAVFDLTPAEFDSAFQGTQSAVSDRATDRRPETGARRLRQHPQVSDAAAHRQLLLARPRVAEITPRDDVDGRGRLCRRG